METPLVFPPLVLTVECDKESLPEGEIFQLMGMVGCFPFPQLICIYFVPHDPYSHEVIQPHGVG